MSDTRGLLVSIVAAAARLRRTTLILIVTAVPVSQGSAQACASKISTCTGSLQRGGFPTMVEIPDPVFGATTGKIRAVTVAIATRPHFEVADGEAQDRQAASLQSQIEAMVHQLVTSGDAQRQLETTPGPVTLDGIAWEFEPGRVAGTSEFGLLLQRDVNQALARRGVQVATPGVRTRGVAGTLIKGAYRVAGSTARVVLSMLDANSGRLVSEAIRTLAPAGLAEAGMKQLLPPASEDARLLAHLLSETLGTDPQSFRITVQTDRGAHAAYCEGEELRVLVESDRDCHLRLYHISWTDKRLTMIYPNRSEPAGYVIGGRTIGIPAEGSSAVFEVARPFGVDAIVAIASESPFEDAALVRAKLDQQDSGWNGSDTVQPPDTPGEPSDVVPGGEDGGLERVGEFLSESGVDEPRAQAVLTRGLVVRHERSSDGTAATHDFGAGSHIGGASGGASIARAVCYFTSLPRISFSR